MPVKQIDPLRESVLRTKIQYLLAERAWVLSQHDMDVHSRERIGGEIMNAIKDARLELGIPVEPCGREHTRSGLDAAIDSGGEAEGEGGC